MKPLASFISIRTIGLAGTAGASLVLAAFAGCSDSSGSPITYPTPDGSTPGADATAGDDAGTPVTDGGPSGPDAAVDGGDDAGPVGAQQRVTQTNLFADTADAGAAHTDPNLVNPWGLAFNPIGAAWVSNNHAGNTTVYLPGSTAPLLVVTLPSAADAGTASPTGQVFNGTAANFLGDKFLFVSEDGTVSGWQTGTTATLRGDSSARHAIYKGLAIAPSTPPVLLAADFHNNHVDVFHADYTPEAVDAGGGSWTDPSVPAGYAPFNIATIGNLVYVAYAKQDPDAEDNAGGPGTGAVSVFDAAGALVKSLVHTGGALNAPWALAAVPASGWGVLPAGAIVVGNFGDGRIHAFDPTTGALVGTLVGGGGATALAIEGLWALQFGVENADAGESRDQLFFTAGPADETHGLFGYLRPAP